jgi:MraZ protein
VEQVFLGRFEHTIDDKGRLTIPAKFRGRLAAGLVLTKSTAPCLWLYPADAWSRLAEKISSLPLADPAAQSLRRLMFADAADLTPDKQGRVILPSFLRQYADIEDAAVVVGLYDHCEVWNPERWQEAEERSDNDPDGRAEKFTRLGI